MPDKAIEEAGLTLKAEPEKHDDIKPLFDGTPTPTATPERVDMQKCKAAAIMFREFATLFEKLETQAGAQLPPIVILWNGFRQAFTIASDAMNVFAESKVAYVDGELPPDIAKAIKPVLDMLLAAGLTISNSKATPDLSWVPDDEKGE